MKKKKKNHTFKVLRENKLLSLQTKLSTNCKKKNTFLNTLKHRLAYIWILLHYKIKTSLCVCVYPPLSPIKKSYLRIYSSKMRVKA